MLIGKLMQDGLGMWKCVYGKELCERSMEIFRLFLGGGNRFR